MSGWKWIWIVLLWNYLYNSFHITSLFFPGGYCLFILRQQNVQVQNCYSHVLCFLFIYRTTFSAFTHSFILYLFLMECVLLKSIVSSVKWVTYLFIVCMGSVTVPLKSVQFCSSPPYVSLPSSSCVLFCSLLDIKYPWNCHYKYYHTFTRTQFPAVL